MLETLTPKQEALMDEIAGGYITGLTIPPEKVNMPAVLAWLDIAYSLFDTKRPSRVEVVDSPFAALKLASALTGEKQTEMDWCGVGDGGWVAFYDYFCRIGILTEEVPERAQVLSLRDFGATAWDTVLLDECAIVIRRPRILAVDADGNLHSGPESPCIEWHDGERDYAHHGQWVPERIVMQPRSYTLEDYKAISNTEHRRALGERAGWDHIAHILGAKSINAWSDPDTGLEYDLLRCEDGSQLLRKQSPKLKNRTQPIYIEPVHEELQTAQAARKWQATSLTPEQCEADPTLSYGVEA